MKRARRWGIELEARYAITCSFLLKPDLILIPAYENIFLDLILARTKNASDVAKSGEDPISLLPVENR